MLRKIDYKIAFGFERDNDEGFTSYIFNIIITGENSSKHEFKFVCRRGEEINADYENVLLYFCEEVRGNSRIMTKIELASLISSYIESNELCKRFNLPCVLEPIEEVLEPENLDEDYCVECA